MNQSSPGRYTVKQVAALTGVLETTLRVWEKRYGVVKPHRSPSGYRLYDDDQVATLRSMAALVADDVPASVAARTVADARPHPAKPTESLEDLDLVAAASSLDPAQLDAVLSQAFARAPIEHLVDAWLLPELERLGHAWAAGEVSVAHEHFAATGVMRALGEQYRLATRAAMARPVLVGLHEGSHHDIGLLAFATCLRRLGVSVVYLGTNVPTADWIKAATELHPRGAVVGVPLVSKLPKAQQLVDRLIALTPPVSVWVGGGHSGQIRRAAPLPHGVAEAANVVANALSGGATPTKR